MNFIKYLLPSKAPEVSPDELLLEYWEIYISSSLRSAMNGNFRKINEVYVPELELVINKEGSPINAFFSNDRYDSKNSLCPHKPKKIKTITIKKDSELGQTIICLVNANKTKQEKELNLVTLFD